MHHYQRLQSITVVSRMQNQQPPERHVSWKIQIFLSFSKMIEVIVQTDTLYC